jgi:hypothetical protein
MAKENLLKEKQRSTKHTYRAKDRIIRTPLKTQVELMYSGWVSSSCSISRNIPAAPAYGVYISQLIRYYRACGTYQDFLERGFVLTRKLLNQGSS